ncbi:MAG: DoxX family protein [Bacteroidetes bacterium]|nr:DoxX family protein [Bacteroidota bacterium]
MKKYKIIFWITTLIIFLWEGVMPALFSNSEMAKEGMRHLGYPEYFGAMLTVFKVLGALALVIPAVSSRIKEWAYAGFAFDFIAAAVSHWSVDGFGGEAIFPIVFVGILVGSYLSYHRLRSAAPEIPLVPAI